MVKIHGIFYIVLSAGILFFSYMLDPQKFRLFIWAGYLFFTVGVFKLVIGFINKKKEFGKKDIGGNIFQQQSHRGNIHHQRKAADNAHRQQGEVIYCWGCGSRLRGHENFCSMCGQKLR